MKLQRIKQRMKHLSSKGKPPKTRCPHTYLSPKRNENYKLEGFPLKEQL